MNRLLLTNLKHAKTRWGLLPKIARDALEDLSSRFRLSVPRGELLYLDGSWYVTHTGLLGVARRNHCHGIHVRPASAFCDSAISRWAFKATVYTSRTCRGFVGYGDADPTNVSPRFRGAEMRVAETRAVNRALRKAFGIGICSVEELGSFSGPLSPAVQINKQSAGAEPINSNRNHPLRDRLCLLIRQHQLDPTLVKSYAADFCDVAQLRQAKREQISAFIEHLAQYAQNDREALLCQLNSYAPKPVSPAPAPPESAVRQEKAEGVA